MTQARDQATETWDYANLLTHATNDRTHQLPVALETGERWSVTELVGGEVPEPVLTGSRIRITACLVCIAPVISQVSAIVPFRGAAAAQEDAL